MQLALFRSPLAHRSPRPCPPARSLALFAHGQYPAYLAAFAHGRAWVCGGGGRGQARGRVPACRASESRLAFQTLPPYAALHHNRARGWRLTSPLISRRFPRIRLPPAPRRPPAPRWRSAACFAGTAAASTGSPFTPAARTCSRPPVPTAASACGLGVWRRAGRGLASGGCAELGRRGGGQCAWPLAGRGATS